ncbi:hypothetical protein UY3_09146 [Chelonia mydas]|uniref:Uncharacterized protein n=1 Tax=Chelonia mydas TaxID=8469 RepID=M7C0G8_CHEMY|nr:hypothetical protein UY3_09146 [Chelonia mydas]
MAVGEFRVGREVNRTVDLSGLLGWPDFGDALPEMPFMSSASWADLTLETPFPKCPAGDGDTEGPIMSSASSPGHCGPCGPSLPKVLLIASVRSSGPGGSLSTDNGTRMGIKPVSIGGEHPFYIHIPVYTETVTLEQNGPFLKISVKAVQAHTVEARAFNSVLGVAQDRNITSGQASLDIDEPSGLRQGGPSRTFLVAILLWD